MAKKGRRLRASEIEKRKKIEESIRIVWDSLESHLESTHTMTSTGKKYIKEIGNYKFHVKCVREYATVIKTLTELL